MKKILALASILAFLDQITKYVASMYFREPLQIIGDTIKFQYAENTGIAFSIPIPPWLIIITNVLLIFLILYLATKELNLKLAKSQIFIALIIGGGLANLIDRIANGYVIDFISIWKYPSFNLADIYITVGVLLTLIFYAKIRPIKNQK